jgi:Fe-S-cluster formation regulator IscX/YfhJ
MKRKIYEPVREFERQTSYCSLYLAWRIVAEWIQSLMFFAGFLTFISWPGLTLAQNQNPPDFKSSLLPLTVSSNRIRAATGQDVILRGVWLSDGLRDIYDGETIRYLRQSWNVNVVHLPIGPTEYERDPKYLEKHVDPIVKACGSNDVYLVLGWHAHGNPLTGKAENPGYKPNLDLAERAVSEMVARYRKAPWVLYSPMNEPAYITWAEFRPVAEKLTDLVHAISPNAIVFVSGMNWAHDLSGVLQDPVRRSNVVYEVHAYPGNQNANGIKWQDTIVQLASRFPVFIGEWGYVDSSQAGMVAASDRFLIGDAESYALPLLALANRLGIGWTPFIYSQHWVPRLIEYRSGSSDVLTQPGVVIREALHHRYHPAAEYRRLWQEQIVESFKEAPLHLNFEAAKTMHNDKTQLRFHMRSAGYNQLYIELQNLNYDDSKPSLDRFSFKFGYDAKSHDLGVEFRQGDGISDKTKINVRDQSGGAVMIPVNISLESRFLISGMTESDQQILAGILQNTSRIVRDAIEDSEKLSTDDRAFWIGSSSLLDLKARQLLEALKSPAWNPKGLPATSDR